MDANVVTTNNYPTNISIYRFWLKSSRNELKNSVFTEHFTLNLVPYFKQNVIIYWSGLISLIHDISTFMDYLMPKPHL